MAAGALLVAACSGDDGDSTATSAPPTGAAPASTTPESTAPASTAPASTEPATTEPATTEPAAPTTTALAMTPVEGRMIDGFFLDENDGWLVVVDDATGATRLWSVVDGGEGYLSSHSWPTDILAVRFATRNDGWAIRAAGVSVTHDAGATWTDLEGIGSIADASPAGVVTSDGAIFPVIGDDIGFVHVATATDEVTPLDAHLPFGAGPVLDVSMATTSAGVFAVYNDRVVAGSVRFLDGAEPDTEWAPAGADAGGPVEVFGRADGPSLWALASQGMWGGDVDHPGDHLYVSEDDGTTFTEVTLPPFTVDPTGFGTRVALPEAGSVVVATTGNVTEGVVLARSDDDGATWTRLGAIRGADLMSLAYAGPDVAYAVVNVANTSGDGGSHTELWRSNDAGATWSPVLVATA